MYWVSAFQALSIAGPYISPVSKPFLTPTARAYPNMAVAEVSLNDSPCQLIAAHAVFGLITEQRFHHFTVSAENKRVAGSLSGSSLNVRQAGSHPAVSPCPSKTDRCFP
jgi:hypothetical protein